MSSPENPPETGSAPPSPQSPQHHPDGGPLRFFIGAGLALFVVVVLVGVFLAGAATGARNPDAIPSGIRSDIVGSEKGPGAFDEAESTIRRVYYRDPGDRALTDTAIAGMVKGLDDRFSQYLTPADYKKFNQQQRNSFDGIGVVVSQDPRGLVVVRVYPGSPAKAAGVRVGDLIVEAGGKNLKGLTSDRASDNVRGPAGTKVKLVVVRKDGKEEKKVTIVSERKPVKIPVVDSAMKTQGGQKIAVVRLAQFTNDAGLQVGEAFEKLRAKGAKKFVLDLRANPGGLVTEAQKLASLFLKGGRIVTLKGRTTGTRPYDAIDGADVFPKIPVVVLVDRGTASAAEIVTGALQDRKRGTVVGTRTFGKGVFQQVEPLDSGGALDITAGQFFTPNGRNLGDKKTQEGDGTAPGQGLAPDVQAKDDPKTTKVDEGLDAALREAAKLKG